VSIVRNPFKRDPEHHRREDRRPLRWIVLGVIAVLTLFGVWIAVNALEAKSQLQHVRDSAQQVKEALVKGDTNTAMDWAERAVAQSQSAQRATHSVAWNIAAAVPVLGGPFTSAQQMADVVAGMAGDILRPAAKAGVGLSPSKLYSNGRIDVQLLRQQEPELRSLAENAERLNARAEAIPSASLIPPIHNARAQLQEQLASTTGLLRDSALAAQLGPAMMGADGPRAYLMAFQTNAEARGTGGLLGGFGVLRFDNGKPRVDTLAPNTELTGATANIDLGQEYADQYGFTNPFTDFRNSNLSSHFPYAAQIWKSMWERQAGQTVDGVIGIDPVALSYILDAEGPVTLADGQTVTAANVVELTESTAYIKFPNDQTARKKYLQDIANEVVKKTTGQIQSPGKLLQALGRAAAERRISIWSANPAEQKILEQTPLAHVIPNDPAPYAEVIINNLGGNKMDYYLKREIEYAADGCSGDMRNATITVRLTNTATGDKLPEYVGGTLGLNPNIPIRVPPGTMVTSVRVLATQGAKLTAVTSNGQRIAAVVHTERGHPTYEVQVAIPPGQSGELSFQLSEPTAPGEPRVPVQPLIDQVTPVVSVPTCLQ
jgi:hypothetical protein